MDPHYSADDLLIITVGELRGRVGQLKTARAQQVALELWRLMDEAFTVGEPRRRRFLEDEALLHDLLGPLGRGPLLALLRELRVVNFKEVLDGLTRRDDSHFRKDESYEKLRGRVHPNIAKARHLLTQLESVVKGDRRMPFHARRSWTCLLVILLIAGGLYINLGWLEQQMALGIWRIALLLILIGGAYGLWYRLTFWVIEKVRVMALYMAFTDQFMPEQEGQ